MDVKLVVIGGKRPGQLIPVQGPKFFIGRSEDCQLRPGSDMVSRNHCAILLEEGFVAVRDFGSKNGTFVNDERVTGERELKPGDRLKIGPLEFEVQIAVNVSGKKKPKVHSVQEAAARAAEAALSGDKEPDISDWLAEEEDDTTFGDATIRETIAGPVEPVAKAPDVPPRAPRIDPLADPNKATKPTAENSREAAADMLKLYFKRSR